MTAKDKGIKAMLDRALMYDKLPMLQVIFEKFIRNLTNSLRNSTSEVVNIEINDFCSLRFGSLIERFKTNFIVCTIHSNELNCSCILMIESTLIHVLIDVLLGGGSKNNALQKIQNIKEYSAIEITLVKEIIHGILYDLSLSFDSVTKCTFYLDQIEYNIHFVNVLRNSDGVVLLNLKIELLDKMMSGSLQLIMPYSSIEPIKNKLEQVFIGDKRALDVKWLHDMQEGLLNVDMDLNVAIVDGGIKLSEASNFKIGDTIILNHHKDNAIAVKCNNIKIFDAKIGKINNNVAINITDICFNNKIK